MDSGRKLSTIYSRGQQNTPAGDVSLRRRLPRVLVVDDNINTMALMRDLLSSRGFDVVAVTDAAQAEAEILRRLPDVILSDVVMRPITPGVRPVQSSAGPGAAARRSADVTAP